MAIREATAFSDATAKRCAPGASGGGAAASALAEAGAGGDEADGRAAATLGTVVGGGPPQPTGNAPKRSSPAPNAARVEDRAALDRTRLLGCALRSTGRNPVGLVKEESACVSSS